MAKQVRNIHLIEVKHCEDTRPAAQLEASQLQHKILCNTLEGAQITQQTILLGVGGTIYTSHTLDHLTQLGLGPQRATKFSNKLHAHSVCYACKLCSTRRALENANASHSQGFGVDFAKEPPNPH